MAIHIKSSNDNRKNGGKRTRAVRNRRRRRTGFLSFHGISGAEWYDYIMTPLLILAAILIGFNIQDVLAVFFIITIRILDLSMVLLFIIALCLVLWFVFFRRRR